MRSISKFFSFVRVGMAPRIPKRKFDRSTLKKGPKSKSSLKSQIKRVVDATAETKKHSTEVNEVAVSTLNGFSSTNVVSLAANTAQGGRIGHSVTGVGLDVRGHIFSNTSRPVYGKLMVIQFKNSAANPVDDLIENNTGNNSVSTLDMTSMWRRINTDSYRVLGQRMLKVGPNRNDTTQMFKMYIPLKRKFTYEGGSAVEPTWGKVRLVFWARTGESDGANETVELHFNTTFYYKDL